MKLSRGEKIVSAQVGGTAERFGDARVERVEALEEIATLLAKIAPGRRGLVLANAAAGYVKAGIGYDYPRDREAAELLCVAGADLDLARSIWLERFPTGSPPPTHSVG